MLRYLLTLVLFLALSCSPIRIYQQLPEVKAWESAIVKFEQLDKSETYPENAVLFAGSSSIVLWSTLAQDMAPYPVIQRGYGGAKISDFAVYADRIIYPHKSRAVVLFIANDISGNDQDKSPEEVAKLFSYILKTIRKKYHDTPVFWIAVTPTALRWNVWPKIKEANDLIKNVCEKHRNTYFISTDYAFLNESGQPREELFRSDKLHLNDKGYVVWSAIIKKELDRVLKD
jgi:hypothetical protein